MTKTHKRPYTSTTLNLGATVEVSVSSGIGTRERRHRGEVVRLTSRTVGVKIGDDVWTFAKSTGRGWGQTDTYFGYNQITGVFVAGSSLDGLTTDQLAALRVFVAWCQNGGGDRFDAGGWKAELRTAWWRGGSSCPVDFAPLQQLRNALGYMWLEEVDTAELMGPFAEPEPEPEPEPACVCAGNGCPECQEPDPETNPAAALVAEAIEASCDCSDPTNACHELCTEAQEDLADGDNAGAAWAAIHAIESACGATSDRAQRARKAWRRPPRTAYAMAFAAGAACRERGGSAQEVDRFLCDLDAANDRDLHSAFRAGWHASAAQRRAALRPPIFFSTKVLP